MDDHARGPLMVKLSNDNLPHLPEGVLRPLYDRASLTAGIVHIGVGNFHRAHQAWYLHRLMQEGLALDWAIIGGGVRAFDETQRRKLAAQDYMTTLIELDPKGNSTEVVGSMIDYVPVEDGNGPLIAQMADPAIRIVALTVTEGGYYIDPATNALDKTHPDIQHDAGNPTTPRTAYGAIVAALRARRDAGAGPFTCQSCDNLQGNGAILRRTVVSLARLSDLELADWIDMNCSFPNSMVDCIVPATGPRELQLVRDLGIDDAVPVTHESFRQWVIEDDFCAGRPEWDKAGATFTSDVHAYETMKLRLLNANHSVIAETGQVLGVETIADCISHPKISAYLKKLATQEIAPTVAPVPEFTPLAYVDLIVVRFSNPRIIDTTRRVAADGSSKHPGFLLPIARERLSAGQDIQGLALAEAVWSRMCAGYREDGSAIEWNDPVRGALVAAAKAARFDPAVWLAQKQFYGDLADDPRFANAFTKWLRMIWSEGTEASIDAYLAG